MGRPENPITWNGPVADLALRLRQLRSEAGRPPYQALARAGHYSATVLSDAAAGRTCPTWDVAKAFAEACGAASGAVAELHSLWVKADAAARRGHTAAARKRAPAAGAVAGPRRQDAPGVRGGEPTPREAANAAQYVRLLRALRAWAGDPGYQEIGRRAGRRVPSSTLYDALSPARDKLPPLDIVQAIAVACASPGSAAGWTAAWRAIRLREFDRDNPVAPDEPAARPSLRVVNDRFPTPD